MFESFEVKLDREISNHLISNVVKEKIYLHNPNRYFVLSSEISNDDEVNISKTIEESWKSYKYVEDRTGLGVLPPPKMSKNNFFVTDNESTGAERHVMELCFIAPEGRPPSLRKYMMNPGPTFHLICW